MSHHSNSEINLTSIEKKVAKNTLLPNPNFLKLIERSHSQISLFSKESNDFSSIAKEVHTNLSKSSFCENLFENRPCSKADFSLQQLLDDTKFGESLILPPGELVINEIIISKSVNIKGSSGSQVLIIGTGFKIQTMEKIVLHVNVSETTFVVQSASGFSINSSAQLEIFDCVVTSLCSQNTFITQSADCSKVNLQSSSVTGFREVLKTVAGCEVFIDKCHFLACEGSSLVLTSPNSVHISQCRIEKCKKSGIEILFNSTQAVTKDIKTVLIEQNDVLNNHGNGISISSEGTHNFYCNLSIIGNKVSYNKKEGLILRHLIIISLNCLKNDFTYNTLSCCWIQKLQKTSKSNKFVLNSNRFSDSLMGYGLYVYSTVLYVDQNEIFRNSLGGLYVTGKCGDCSEVFSLFSSFVDSNCGNGVEICDFSNTVCIESCKISENLKNGLSCLVSEKFVGKLLVEAKFCEFKENSEYGAVLVRTKCNVVKCVIEGNRLGEILFGELSAGLVRIDDRSFNSLSRLVTTKPGKSCKGVCMIY